MENKTGRILCIDDELDILIVLKKGLEKYGFAVDTVSDPELALRGYRPGRYDMLLIDYRMPAINGFDLYKKIYEIDNVVRVCFLTALEHKMEEYKRVFPSWKGVCFITKPIRLEQLKAKLEELLQN